MTARANRNGDVSGALPLLEEAFHLLRRTPASLLLVFYAGSVPFVLDLLYFIADRTRTGRPGVGPALGAAVLYLAMKVAQAFFARGLRRRLGPAENAPPAWRHAVVQLEAQPWSLFALPISFVIGLPFGWVVAYYQSLAVTGERAAARRHAGSWARQNHLLLALLALSALFVFLNMLVLLLTVPSLLHSLLGVQSAAAANPWGMLSTTTLAVAIALTYLAVAPLSRAAYALRCFYRDARTSGDDLRGELRSIRRGLAGAGVAALVLLATPVSAGAAVVSPTTVSAQARAHPATASSIDESLTRVLERREFAWRLPRAAEPGERGFLARFAQPILDATTRWVSSAVDGLRSFFDWLRRKLRLRPPSERPSTGDFSWIGWTEALFALAALLVAAGTILLLRRLRRRRTKPVAVVPPAMAPAIADLMADEAAAAALPYEQWLDAARALLAAGDARGAVRAAYLAALALLAHRQLVMPARSKSNRDYQSELRRRARDRPELPLLFAEAVAAFERVWYGRHAADAELAAWSMTQVDRLRTHAD